MKKINSRLTTVLSALLLSLASALAPALAEQNKTVEIFAEKGADMTIKVNVDGNEEVIVVSMDEANDEQLLADKLSGLDQETRADIMQSLSALHGAHGRVIKLHKNTEHHVEWHGDDGDIMQVEMEVDGDNTSSPKVMKHIIKVTDDVTDNNAEHMIFAHGDRQDHANLIIHMINKTQLTADELDRIQAALDQKR